MGADREVLDDNRAWLNLELADLPAAVEHAVDLPAAVSAGTHGNAPDKRVTAKSWSRTPDGHAGMDLIPGEAGRGGC